MEIKNWTLVDDGTPVVAMFDVYFDKMRFSLVDIKLVLNKKGSHFFSFPSVCRKDHLGNKKWVPAYHYSEERQKEFINALYDSTSPFMAGIIRPAQKDD